MPVWLAFMNRADIDSKKITFDFIPISSLQKFWGGLFDFYVNKQDFEDIKILRIPNELLTSIDSKIIFEVGYTKIDDQLLSEFANKNIGLNRVIKDKIKEVIRKKDCFKSHISNEITRNEKYVHPFEVGACLKSLINENVIEYKPKHKLKLLGE